MDAYLPILLFASLLAGFALGFYYGRRSLQTNRRRAHINGSLELKQAREAVAQLFPDAPTFTLMEAKGEHDPEDHPRCHVTVGDRSGKGETWNDAILDLIDR